MTQKIINASPHAIHILGPGNTIVRVFPKSNGMIRVKEYITDAEPIDNVPITNTKWGECDEVPAFVEGTYYIVSQLVKTALPHRKDMLVPKNIVRDGNGNIMGCMSLDQ
jgi:hypothetical protein